MIFECDLTDFLEVFRGCSNPSLKCQQTSIEVCNFAQRFFGRHSFVSASICFIFTDIIDLNKLDTVCEFH